jgi:ABC-type long-subunit fatty acid transport system fused permease/ATPase subunit
MIVEKEERPKPLFIIAIIFALLALFLFLEGLSLMPNNQLQDEIPLESIVFIGSGVICAILTKLCCSITKDEIVESLKNSK